MYKKRRILDDKFKAFCKEVFVSELGFKLEEKFDDGLANLIHCCMYEEDEIIAYIRVNIQNKCVQIRRIAVKMDKARTALG